MARHKKVESLEEDQPALDISSLIDCTFLLLIYFLVTTTIQKREQDLDMTLPAAAPSQSQPDIDPKFIKVDSNGAISVGAGASQIPMDTDPGVRDLPLLTADLQSYASAAKSADSKPLVQLYVDGAANQQRVIDVLNALAGVGISNVTFTDLVDP
ncbi:MAG: biopolymer transporter ExbD [Verrucomicrobia bacterium]|nr:MAG: biopolymer transporter ExbD [Verrucomicrobiota bacterium]TAE88323.1 MAG: biopolymer transporter ExbD [Verrucomicrobiota bacterium]TAF26777.1 MAG: biopolymer transporter ExbD [Verrucomicrobiota bacterium]TAF42033.1 MAG: biopolymer transporter ExbD [Verrucomicrobiota bacterium]